MQDRPRQMELSRYTLWSLQFSGTSFTAWRNERLLRIVNGVYLELIRSGWAVPLSFVLDVAALLLYSMAVPRDFPAVTASRCPRSMRDLSSRYRAMLVRLRRDPVFGQMVELLREVPEPKDQDHAVSTLLPFLIKAAGGFQNIYSFKSREMTVRLMKILPQGAGMGWTDAEGRQNRTRHFFRELPKVIHEEEMKALMDILHLLCEHFESTSVQEILTPERQLVIEIAARTPRGAARVDYQCLSWLLNQPQLDDVAQEPPLPRFVHEIVPTSLLEIEGQSGGYIDISRINFSGSVSTVLPAELGLWPSREFMLQKLLNEGVLTYVRENDEYIERELRVLICFVIDNAPRMVQNTNSADRGPGHGLTPWMRARALALLLLQDLARWMPRSDVRIDCGVYLWSQHPWNSPRTRQAPLTCQAQLDLFSWSKKNSEDRLTFLRGLTRCFPEIFYGQVSMADSEVRPELEVSPYSFMKHRQATHHYHCRHLIYLSSASTLRDLLAEAPGDLQLQGQDSGPDSIHLVTCDTDRSSLGVARLDTMEDAWNLLVGPSGAGSCHLPGQISEERLRHQIVSAVILKGAGKPPMSNFGYGLEDDLLS